MTTPATGPPGGLEAYLGGRTPLAESRVDVRGTGYAISHALSADALIDEAEFEADERLPYWADLWPSAIALARHLATQDLRDKKAIELGCGVGLPSTVALARGADILATDHYEAALAFARHNARINTGGKLETALLDWRAPRTEGLGVFDLVLAADVLYEGRNVSPLAALVSDLLAPEGELILADPRRASAPQFLAAMESDGFSVRSEQWDIEGAERAARVLLYTVSRRGRGPTRR